MLAASSNPPATTTLSTDVDVELQCQCCKADFESKTQFTCSKCGNAMCQDCSRTKDDGQLNCQDCEFVMRWTQDYNKGSEKKGWKFLSKLLARSKSSSNGNPKTPSKNQNPNKDTSKTPTGKTPGRLGLPKQFSGFSNFSLLRKTPSASNANATTVYTGPDAVSSPGGVSDILADKEQDIKEQKQQITKLNQRIKELQQQLEQKTDGDGATASETTTRFHTIPARRGSSVSTAATEENDPTDTAVAAEEDEEKQGEGEGVEQDKDKELEKGKDEESSGVDHKAEIDDESKSAEQLKQEIGALRKEGSKLEKEVERLTSELETARTEIEELKKQLQGAAVASSSSNAPSSSAINTDTSTIPTPPPLPGGMIPPSSLQPNSSEGGGGGGSSSGTSTTNNVINKGTSTIPTPPPLPGGISPPSAKGNNAGSGVPSLPGAPTNGDAGTGARRGSAPSAPAMPPPPGANGRRGSAPAVVADDAAKPQSKFAQPKKSIREKVANKTGMDVKENGDLRPVFWQVLPSTRVENSVWSELTKEAPDCVALEDFKILEQKFTKPKTKTLKPKADSASGKNGATGSASAAAASSVPESNRPKILDGNRQQNLAIALARFRAVSSNQELRKAIIGMDMEVLTMDVVSKLMNLAPTPEEAKLVQELIAENQDDPDYWKGMTREEEFVVEMATIPRLQQRLQCIFVEQTFKKQADSLSERIGDYEEACKQLMTCKEWKKLLHLVLSCGNYVNDGNKSRGGAWGIELTTGLPKLAQCKAGDGGKYTLLHWIAEVAEKNSPELFNLPDLLSKVADVSGLKLEDLKSDMTQLSKGANLLQREVDACRKGGSSGKTEGAAEFAKALTPFLENTAAPQTQKLRERLEKVEETSREVVTHHGENAVTVTSQKLFQTILTFCDSLIQARKENQKAAEKEAASAAGAGGGGGGPNDKKEVLEKHMKKDLLNKKIKSGALQNGLSGAKRGHGLQQNELQAAMAKMAAKDNGSSQ